MNATSRTDETGPSLLRRIHSPRSEGTFVSRSCVRPCHDTALTQSVVRYHDIEECDRLFLVGTTLATYSAFRYVQGMAHPYPGCSHTRTQALETCPRAAQTSAPTEHWANARRCVARRRED